MRSIRKGEVYLANLGDRKKLDNLEKDSVVLCNAIKMIDSHRIMSDKKRVLTRLSNDEIVDIENILYNLFGCK